MLRQTLVVLGIGAVVAGLSPIAHAQSTMPSSPNSGTVTLSGQSLRAVESRTITEDFRNFFNRTSQTTQNTSATPVGRLTQSPRKSPLGDVLNDNVDVVFGDTLNREQPITSFPASGDVGDNNRVKLQLQLGNQ